jgi:hypothetical protein
VKSTRPAARSSRADETSARRPARAGAGRELHQSAALVVGDQERARTVRNRPALGRGNRPAVFPIERRIGLPELDPGRVETRLPACLRRDIARSRLRAPPCGSVPARNSSSRARSSASRSLPASRPFNSSSLRAPLETVPAFEFAVIRQQVRDICGSGGQTLFGDVVPVYPAPIPSPGHRLRAPTRYPLLRPRRG